MDSIITVLVRILEVIFMVGILGSAVVLILTLIEDAKSLLPGDEKKESTTQSSPNARPANPHLHPSDTVA
jgi:hypothetical protein